MATTIRKMREDQNFYDPAGEREILVSVICLGKRVLIQEHLMKTKINISCLSDYMCSAVEYDHYKCLEIKKKKLVSYNDQNCIKYPITENRELLKNMVDLCRDIMRTDWYTLNNVDS